MSQRDIHSEWCLQQPTDYPLRQSFTCLMCTRPCTKPPETISGLLNRVLDGAYHLRIRNPEFSSMAIILRKGLFSSNYCTDLCMPLCACRRERHTVHNASQLSAVQPNSFSFPLVKIHASCLIDEKQSPEFQLSTTPIRD